MKTAIYIEDGVIQLVITPESDFEKNALSTLSDKPADRNHLTRVDYFMQIPSLVEPQLRKKVKRRKK